MSADKHGSIVLGQQNFIEVEDTGKKWITPDTLLHEGQAGGEGDPETKWLQISAAN